MTDQNTPDRPNMANEDAQDKDLERLLKIAGDPPAPDEARKAEHRQQLTDTWRESVQQHRRTRWRRVLPPLGLAASLVLAVVLLVNNSTLPAAVPIAEIVYRIGDIGLTDAAARENGALFPGDLLVTQQASALTFSLTDETIVQLDASTEVTLQQAGELWLHRGRVFVDSPGLQSSVVIHTAWGTLRDTGTAFEVSVNDQALQLAMREGVVELTLRDADQPTARATVENGAGDVITVDTSMALTRHTRTVIAEQWNWTRRGALAFPEGRHSLDDVLLWAARQSGRQVSYGSPLVELQVKNEVVRWPSIEALTMETQLQEISQTTDYDVVFTEAEIMVKPKR